MIERARPQVAALVLNANGDPGAVRRASACRSRPTWSTGFAGPLAGVLTGMEWARAQRPDCAWIATIATDTPFFPARPGRAAAGRGRREGADLACAARDGRAHPVFGLWPVRLADDLRRAMIVEEIRKVDLWTARYRLVEVDFPAEPFDPFFNANRPEDLAEAERLLSG